MHVASDIARYSFDPFLLGVSTHFTGNAPYGFVARTIEKDV